MELHKQYNTESDIRLFFMENEKQRYTGFPELFLEKARLYEERFDYNSAKALYKKGLQIAKDTNNQPAYRLFTTMLLDLIID